MKQTAFFTLAALALLVALSGCDNTIQHYDGDNGTRIWYPTLTKPKPQVPGTPAVPALTPAEGQLTVIWTAVGGATAYEVWYGDSNNSASAARFGSDITGTSAIITGLTNGTACYVWIKAKNSVGVSGFSPAASGTPREATAAPGTPAAPALSSGDSRLTVSWMPVEDATAYEVWYGTLNNSASAAQFGGDIAVLGTAITGLAAETTYYVWIKAKNTAGTSGFSPAATGMSLSPPPPAPNAPTLTPGSTQLTVTWTAVNGATAYEVWRGTSNNSANAAKFGADITGGTTSVVITGLTNETTYYVWIKAKNSMGTSDFSPAASGIPMPLPPAAPAAPALYQADSQLAASWTAVSGATAYEVWYGDSNNSASAARFGSDITGTSAIITGLTNGTACYVWIKAKNSVGVSGFSPAASGTPAAATGVPAAPAAPMVTRGDGTLIVTWIPVEGATEYEVRYGTGAATILFGSFTGTSAVITGLVNTTLYRVRLRAQNSAGYSGYSGNTIAVIAPAAPNITAGDTQLVVSWTTVTGATAYEVWFNEENNAATARQSGGDIFSPQTTATITGLTNGTVYYVWVKAKTAASWSGFSPGASGTPQSHQVTVGYAGGNITITDSAGTAVSGITLSKTGSQTITLNADGAFTGVVWYIDGSNGIVTTKLTLSAAGYAVSKHFVTFTGWWNGAYVSSAPIPFTVTN